VVDSEGNVLEIIKDEKYMDEEDEDDEAEQGAHIYRFRQNHSNTAPPGHYDPGPADLFPAPFVGITRYATTTRRNRTLSTKSAKQNSEERLKRHISRRYSQKVTSPTSAAPVNFAHTISMGNTSSGEDGIGRERRWLQPFPNRRSSSWELEDDQKIPLEEMDDQMGKLCTVLRRSTEV